VYTFEMSGDSVEIITPGGAKIEIEDGKVVEVIDGEIKSDINEERRLQANNCENGYDSCLIGASGGCTALAFFCEDIGPSSPLFSFACSDFSFCLPEAIQAACGAACREYAAAFVCVDLVAVPLLSYLCD